MKIDPSLLEQAFAGLPDSITIQDRNFRILYQNPAIRDSFGSHIGHECFRVYEGREQICEGCGLQKTFATGKPTLVVRSVVDADGRKIVWENSCVPLYDQNGEIVAGIEVCRDITDRVTLQDEVAQCNSELNRLNQEYRSLLDHLPDYIVRYDSELRRTYVNPAWERDAGLAAQEVVGVAAEAILKVSKTTNDEYLKKLRQALATGQAQHCEFEWQNAHGELLYLSYQIIPEFDDAGQVASVLAVGTDLSKRKASEEALRRERSLLRCIIDSASDLIFVKDCDGRYQLCNKASEAFIGLPESEQVGKDDFDFFPREMAERIRENDRQVIEQGNS